MSSPEEKSSSHKRPRPNLPTDTLTDSARKTIKIIELNETLFKDMFRQTELSLKKLISKEQNAQSKVIKWKELYDKQELPSWYANLMKIQIPLSENETEKPFKEATEKILQEAYLKSFQQTILAKEATVSQAKAQYISILSDYAKLLQETLDQYEELDGSIIKNFIADQMFDLSTIMEHHRIQRDTNYKKKQAEKQKHKAEREKAQEELKEDPMPQMKIAVAEEVSKQLNQQKQKQEKKKKGKGGEQKQQPPPAPQKQAPHTTSPTPQAGKKKGAEKGKKKGGKKKTTTKKKKGKGQGKQKN